MDPTSQPESAAWQHLRASRRQVTVLVVEDDPATHAAMRVLLEHYDYHVLHARTVADGIKMLERRPQFLFLDLMLPDGDGAEVLERLRLNDMPTIVAVITGTNDHQRLERVKALRPDHLLRKPLDFLAMLRQLRSDQARNAGSDAS